MKGPGQSLVGKRGQCEKDIRGEICPSLLMINLNIYFRWNLLVVHIQRVQYARRPEKE